MLQGKEASLRLHPKRRPPRAPCVRHAATKTQSRKYEKDTAKTRRIWRLPWPVAKTFLCESCPPFIPCNLAVATACICLQRASCYSPATSQLHLVLKTCSRCTDCKKAVVWYNSVLGPLPSLLALICSCRCAFCKDMIPVTAFKNSTRHFNMNSGMPLHTRYLHDLNS